MEEQCLRVCLNYMSEIGIAGSTCIFVLVLQYLLSACGPQHCRETCSNVRGGLDFQKLPGPPFHSLSFYKSFIVLIFFLFPCSCILCWVPRLHIMKNVIFGSSCIHRHLFGMANLSDLKVHIKKES